MDKCPQCNLTTRCDSGGYLENTQVLRYFCINSQCVNGKLNTKHLVFPFVQEEIPMPKPDGNPTKMCCNEPIAHIDENMYYIPPRTDSTATLETSSGTLTVICPTCLRQHTFNVLGREKVV